MGKKNKFVLKKQLFFRSDSDVIVVHGSDSEQEIIIIESDTENTEANNKRARVYFGVEPINYYIIN